MVSQKTIKKIAEAIVNDVPSFDKVDIQNPVLSKKISRVMKVRCNNAFMKKLRDMWDNEETLLRRTVQELMDEKQTPNIDSITMTKESTSTLSRSENSAPSDSDRTEEKVESSDDGGTNESEDKEEELRESSLTQEQADVCLRGLERTGYQDMKKIAYIIATDKQVRANNEVNLEDPAILKKIAEELHRSPDDSLEEMIREMWNNPETLLQDLVNNLMSVRMEDFGDEATTASIGVTENSKTTTKSSESVKNKQPTDHAMNGHSSQHENNSQNGEDTENSEDETDNSATPAAVAEQPKRQSLTKRLQFASKKNVEKIATIIANHFTEGDEVVVSDPPVLNEIATSLGAKCDEGLEKILLSLWDDEKTGLQSSVVRLVKINGKRNNNNNTTVEYSEDEYDSDDAIDELVKDLGTLKKWAAVFLDSLGRVEDKIIDLKKSRLSREE